MNAKSDPKTILFLCTGNYYRSRFAEVMFNSGRSEDELTLESDLARFGSGAGIYNIGPMARAALEMLELRGIRGSAALRDTLFKQHRQILTALIGSSRCKRPSIFLCFKSDFQPGSSKLNSGMSRMLLVCCP